MRAFNFNINNFILYFEVNIFYIANLIIVTIIATFRVFLFKLF